MNVLIKLDYKPQTEAWKPVDTSTTHSSQIYSPLHIICNLTKRKLLSGVWGESEAEHRHGSNQDTRDDQVEEVVQGPPPDVDLEGDVKVGLRTAVIRLGIPLSRHILI